MEAFLLLDIMKERDFKGIWIPKEIWLSDKLTMQEKLFLVEIDSLDNEKNCYASNGHFADFFGLSKGRCSQIISSLKEKGYIEIDYYFDDKKVKKRVIKVLNKLKGGIKNPKGGIKNPKGGYLENDKGRDTSNSNTYNNTGESNVENSKKEPQFSEHPFTKELIEVPSFEDFYNLYDYKVSKKEAKKAWQKLNGKQMVAALVAVPYYKRSLPEWQDMKHPSTFLNQETWCDEAIYNKKQNKNGKNTKIQSTIDSLY